MIVQGTGRTSGTPCGPAVCGFLCWPCTPGGLSARAKKGPPGGAAAAMAWQRASSEACRRCRRRRCRTSSGWPTIRFLAVLSHMPCRMAAAHTRTCGHLLLTLTMICLADQSKKVSKTNSAQPRSWQHGHVDPHLYVHTIASGLPVLLCGC